ncbi:MAG: hypothetical protein MUD12_16170 [Spirochaetes bacterium]|jgi:protein-S-isoprenylcysteine O-methyltransferase Ste14|nr:hypothetical protein [Spirochaetota bacterium]
MERIIIMILFAVLLLSFIIRLGVFRMNGKGTGGLPSVNGMMFRAGKMTMVASWMLLMLHINIRDISVVDNASPVRYAAIALLSAGVLLNILSSINLGFSFRMGLPAEDTVLKTGGLYGFSRNPMLLSLFLVSMASGLYTMSPPVWVLTAVTIFIHHRIIVSEEEFLSGRFGEVWDAYSKNVRRYL